jgi:hypothetical protein
MFRRCLKNGKPAPGDMAGMVSCWLAKPQNGSILFILGASAPNLLLRLYSMSIYRNEAVHP